MIARIVGTETLWAEVNSGYCAGDPYRPRIDRVTLRWRKLSPGRFRAELTALVRSPVYSQPARAGEGPANVQVCAGIGYGLRAKVVLPRPIAQVDLFDAYYSPPRRMRGPPPLLVAPGVLD